jgi:polysaccharide pyruvyl transferase WcaK-like protein
MDELENIIVLGFYNRKNIGDDSYEASITSCFKRYINNNILFYCMDDIDEIPAGTDIVLCGGGDIINDYFMKKAQVLLKSFTGRVYAISVGIPYYDGSKYLHLFDHVFVRSSRDYNIACAEIGSQNVTQSTDLSVLYNPSRYNKNLQQRRRKMRLGVSLAQPLFHDNDEFKAEFIETLRSAVGICSNIELHFFIFNYGNVHNAENDIYCTNDVVEGLGAAANGIDIYIHDEADLKSTVPMMQYMAKEIDFMLCMRYHSVMFSVLTHIPFLPIYCSQKIHSLLRDLDIPSSKAFRLPCDENDKPITGFKEELQELITTFLTSDWHDNDYSRYIDTGRYKWLFEANDLIFKRKQQRHFLINKYTYTFDDILTKCRRDLCKYLNIDIAEFERLLMNIGPFPCGSKKPIDIARCICLIISGSISHPCLWGLYQNLQKDTFCLYDSLQYIWKDCFTRQSKDMSEHYYPYIPLRERSFVNIDFVFKNEFSDYHRSGWAYVVGGMKNLDAPHLSRTSDILVDTYVDRSFHWGYDTMKSLGIIPYREKWVGFIHHTFDETHSNYNCCELFKNPCFLESLSTCKGLIVLSQYLKKEIERHLLKLPTPRVYVLYHPMEFVENTFTLEKFFVNTNKMVIQIGAWLRNPYAIYALPCCLMQKAALKGKEMDLYFPPEEYHETIKDIFCDRDWGCRIKDENNNSICRDDNACNKFCKGVYEVLAEQMNSVKILEKLDNNEYDRLLSENIVFLNLVDCSAVNTVIECIVRDTPLIVNRHPALEEVLGKRYPGFYQSINDAGRLCDDYTKIAEIHNYMKKLDKERFSLDHFIKKFQAIILDCDPEYVPKQSTRKQKKKWGVIRPEMHGYLPM